MKESEIEEMKEPLLSELVPFYSSKPQLAAALSKQLQKLQITVPPSMKYLIEGFRITLNALSPEGKYIDVDVEEETGSDLNLETFLTGEILKSNKNLINFLRENDQQRINYSLNYLIIASIALTTFQLVDINFALLKLIDRWNKQNDPQKQLTGYQVKDPETADTAISFFLETKANPTRTRCLRYGFHGPSASFALTVSEFKQIRKYCVKLGKNETEKVKWSIINELKDLVKNKKKDLAKSQEFISLFQENETVHELKQTFSKCPFRFVNSFLSLKESFEKTPSIGIEENTHAGYYYDNEYNKK